MVGVRGLVGGEGVSGRWGTCGYCGITALDFLKSFYYLFPLREAIILSLPSSLHPSLHPCREGEVTRVCFVLPRAAQEDEVYCEAARQPGSVRQLESQLVS